MKEAESSVASHSPSLKVAVTWHHKLGHMSKQGMKIHVERKLLPGLTTVYKARVKLDSGKKIKCVMTDNGGEYTGDEFDPFCRQEGIKSQFTIAYTPQQNGVVDRMNRTLLKRARAMLAITSLGKSFWAKAINIACYVINRSPSTVVELKTPMEMWMGKPINYSDLHIFGSHVYIIDDVFVEDKIQENTEGDSTTKETTSIQMEKEFQLNISFEVAPQHEEGEPSTLQDTLNNTDALFWKEQCKKESKLFLDVKTVFLHGKIEEEIYMLKPEGFEQKRKENLVCRESNLIAKGYVNSDYAGDFDGSKSTTRYLFTLSGGSVSWVSKLQLVVAMSTTEAEYVADAQASKEAVWLKMLLEELGHEQEKITLFYDNHSASYLARNPIFYSKTKHIRVQYHFVCKKVEEGTVDMQKIHTTDNVADYLTKAINCDKFIWCGSLCGLAKT
nr:Gag-Pol polyprotein [Tanacetum cinerariifolium]